MDSDSLNFGSEAAGGTPDADSILAQPPLQEESPSKEETSGEGQAAESMYPDHSKAFTYSQTLTRIQLLMLP
jgi:hypothetical protein